MTATTMMERFGDASPRFKARTAGAFWLTTMITGILAISAGDGWKLAANIVATACYVAATLLVYELLKPVNEKLSRIAAFFGLLGSASGFAHYALQIADRIGPAELQGLARTLLSLRAHAPNADSIFFGLHCLLLGALLFRSTFLPRFLGALTTVAGVAWLALSLTGFLAPPLGRSLSPYFMAVGGLGEGSLILWLLVIGVDVQRWSEQAASSQVGEEAGS